MNPNNQYNNQPPLDSTSKDEVVGFAESCASELGITLEWGEEE